MFLVRFWIFFGPIFSLCSGEIETQTRSLPGFLLILHGSPCAGKSTLAEKLESSLDFYCVKKTPFSMQLKADYIEQITGVRPGTDLEVLEAWISISPPKEVRKAIYKETWRLTFQRIRELVAQGKWVVLDTCLTDPFVYDPGIGRLCINDFRVASVLIYAPLPSLLKRVHKRTEDLKRSSLLDQRSRAAVLSCFYSYYVPFFDGLNEPLDWVDASDLWHFDVPEEECIFPDLKKRIERLFQQWFSSREGLVPIRPIKKDDLILNSDRCSIEEEVQAIKELCESLMGCD